MEVRLSINQDDEEEDVSAFWLITYSDMTTLLLAFFLLIYSFSILETSDQDDLVRALNVVTQGGDGYGAAQAFKAAGRPTPIIVMGNRHDELTWWKEQKDANGYETMSVSIAPGVSTLAFWVAQQVLDGATVPQDLTVPFLTISQDTLEENLENTQAGGVANVEYSLEDAKAVISGG